MIAMNENLEDRLFNLEKNCSYLEDRCEKFSELLIAADNEIERLKRRIDSLESSFDAPEVRPIERPPHY